MNSVLFGQIELWKAKFTAVSLNTSEVQNISLQLINKEESGKYCGLWDKKNQKIGEIEVSRKMLKKIFDPN
jgi:hypothetical protein